MKNQVSKVLEIEMCGRMKEAWAGDSVLLLLDKEFDIKRGDILIKTLAGTRIALANRLENGGS